MGKRSRDRRSRKKEDSDEDSYSSEDSSSSRESSDSSSGGRHKTSTTSKWSSRQRDNTESFHRSVKTDERRRHSRERDAGRSDKDRLQRRDRSKSGASRHSEGKSSSRKDRDYEERERRGKKEGDQKERTRNERSKEKDNDRRKDSRSVEKDHSERQKEERGRRSRDKYEAEDRSKARKEKEYKDKEKVPDKDKKGRSRDESSGRDSRHPEKSRSTEKVRVDSKDREHSSQGPDRRKSKEVKAVRRSGSSNTLKEMPSDKKEKQKERSDQESRKDTPRHTSKKNGKKSKVDREVPEIKRRKYSSESSSSEESDSSEVSESEDDEAEKKKEKIREGPVSRDKQPHVEKVDHKKGKTFPNVAESSVREKIKSDSSDSHSESESSSEEEDENVKKSSSSRHKEQDKSKNKVSRFRGPVDDVLGKDKERGRLLEDSEDEKQDRTPERKDKDIEGDKTGRARPELLNNESDGEETPEDKKLSDEEKEEGEISEDEEENRLASKPLIAISDNISDISSDESQHADDELETTKESVKSTAVKSPSVTHDNDKNVASPSPNRTQRKGKKAQDEEGGKKQKRIVSVVSDDGGDKKSTYSQGAQKRVEPPIAEEPEDSRLKERPVLESDSESDGGEHGGGLSSQVLGKTQVVSSVSVMRKPQETSSRRRSRSHDRGGRGDRRREDRSRDVDGRRSYREDRREDSREERRYGDSRKRRRSEERRDGDQSVSARRAKADEPPTVDAAKKPPEKKTAAAGVDIMTKTGGAYIPPAKLRMMQEAITDKTSVAYQRMSWEALKKSINGLINKVNVSNLINIIRELFQENIVRGRGLLARSVIQAQAASPTFTHVYAALVAIINTKFPQVGELILRRLILMFRRGFRRNDKGLCLSSTRFIAHLVNQQVAHEVLALEILTLLLETPTDDSVEVAIGFFKECGQKLSEVSPRGVNSVFERLRRILHEGSVATRVQYMVEVMFAVRKDGFKDHPAVQSELDLVEEEEQFTHLLQLEDAVNGDEMLNVFRESATFGEDEEKYKSLKKEILDEGSSDDGSGESGSDSSDSDDDDDDDDEEGGEKQTIVDQTETNLIALRRTIYLTVQSSLDHNECAHKMMKMELKPGQEIELCNMILDCCAQLRTYEKFFGLLAQRFCQIDKKYIEPFQQLFLDQYETIHRLETSKLRNVARFFAHLLHTDAISWGVLSAVKLSEEDTTSASRIFLKILFQELSEFMGLLKLNDRLKDKTLQPYFEGIMPRDNPKNTRFAINFFTTIGLGGLTDDLREHLKSVTKQMVQLKQEEEAAAAVQDDSSDSSDSDSSSSSESDSSDSESDSEPARKRKKKDSRSNASASASSSRKKKNQEEDRSRPGRNKSGKDARHDSSEERRGEKSSRKGGRVDKGGKRGVNGKGADAPQRKTIADRLLDMAQYGNIQNGDQRSQEKDRGRESRDQRPEARRDKGGRNSRGRDSSREKGKRDESREDRRRDRDRKRDEERSRDRGREGSDRERRIEEDRRHEVSRGSGKRRDEDRDRQKVKDDSRTGRRRNESDERDFVRKDAQKGDKQRKRKYESEEDDEDFSRERSNKRSEKDHGRRSESSGKNKENQRKSQRQEVVARTKRSRSSDENSSSDESSEDDRKLSRKSKSAVNSKKRKPSLSSDESSEALSSSSEEDVTERRIVKRKPKEMKRGEEKRESNRIRENSPERRERRRR